MGQPLSKRIIPILQRAMQRQEAETAKEAMREVAEKERKALSMTRYSDPSSLIGGFTRGLEDDNETSAAIRKNRERDARQEQFLKQQNADTPDEMPKDLLNFIHDMGPAKRTVDTTRTSKRILKKVQETGAESLEDVVQNMEQEQRNRRRQLWSTHTAANTAEIPEGDSSAQKLRNTKNQDSSSGSDKAMAASSKEEEEEMMIYKEEQITQLLQNILSGATKDAKDTKDIQIDDKTFQNISKYISYPVIMRDTDEDLVGAWPHKVNDLKRLGLTIDDLDSSEDSNPKTQEHRKRPIHFSN